MKKLLIPLAIATIVAACSTTSPDVISRDEAQRLATVQDGIVLSIRAVTVDGTQSGLGAATGAVVGGIAGSTAGGRREGTVGGALGAVVGGVVGNAVERASTKEDAVEILVQLSNGERKAIVQAKGSETLNPGDAVILVINGSKTHVTKAPVIAPATKGAATHN